MEEYFLPGFRFYPTEEELASFYLPNKLNGRREDLNHIMDMVIPVLHIYDFHPWDLPQLAGEVCRGDPEQWFFFVPIQESEARGGRPNRLTSSGYWKATGSPGYVYSSNNRIIAEKKTMVFYRGRAPTGRKTDWKMNEYKAIDHGEAASSTTALPMARQEFSLCRVYKKSKSLRAFDRRPPLGVVVGQPRAATQEVHGDFEATTCRRDRPLMVEMTSSPDMNTSSSGYHGGLPSQAAAGENDESMWDLEEFASLVLGDGLEQLNA